MVLPLTAILAVVAAVADTTPRPQLRAVRISEPVAIDGRLDDAAWRGGALITTLVQSSPTEGAPASEATAVHLAYDDAALYVAARLRDRAPDSVMALLTRRDRSSQSDFFSLYLDPLGDRRTGYEFTVSAAGVQSDGTLYNDDWSDDAWDGVWQSSVRRDGEGWIVEMRIPLSQLRVAAAGSIHWGVNVGRGIGRRNEVSYLIPRLREGSGFVSRFAELLGPDEVTPRRRAELLPYLTGKHESAPTTLGNPFRTGSQTTPSVGADFRLGMGRGFQLDGTVNPDFGQVEVDPAVVNLSDVEVFFDERRPFFVEGINVFRFGYGGANNFMGFNWVNLDPFYSRRIGRAPQGRIPESPFSEAPQGVRILGAAKLTGRLGSWNVGTLSALTQREHARLSDGTVEQRAEIEPLAGYGVVRAQRDFAGGRHGLGVLGTVTHRDFRDNSLRDQMDAGAQLAGLDGWLTLDSKRTWVMSGWGAISRVTGTAARITALQAGAGHYYQRPDADHVELDPDATTMSGSFGRLTLNKQNGSTLFNAAVGAVSPGFEANDLGFVGRTDVLNAHVSSGYRWTKPRGLINSARYATTIFGTWDFGGARNSAGWWNNVNITWSNFSGTYFGGTVNPASTNVRGTRGGPAMASPGGFEAFAGWTSDERKPLSFEVELSGSRYAGGERHAQNYSIAATYRPASNVSISVGPSYEALRNPAQYLRAADDPAATATYGRRYLFGDLDQQTLSGNIRVNWILSPKTSIELFAQPLISSGRYHTVRELRAPGTFAFRDFGTEGSTVDRAAGVVDPDGAGAAPAITIGQPDFTFASLRGNAVFRWEYTAGSTFFLVWTQQRAYQDSQGRFAPGSSFDRLLSEPGQQVLMMKLSYWLNR
ncbi:MAG: carbohydrate binding family 9 domain-containing protein [Gemmatimonadales bacterium]|nr:carbohydrate binding family 9 domain-containing protein [Gemmatimonadales bacterium]MBP6571734.1 carbohydrate binding family 9 domain-containing protein [Gemmatimonadales bacterium]MBP7621289.1 carbohydrate binding family 9 domain-containing protein [Gemmatimonadales bacterium]